MRSVLAGGDHAYAGATPVLTGPAASPVLAESMVQLTAGVAAARAEVVAYDRQGRRLDGATVELQPHSTDVWQPPRRAGYVVVEPEGRVTGATIYRGASAVPLRDLPLTLRVPVVQPAL
jgi:hypothetical protein